MTPRRKILLSIAAALIVGNLTALWLGQSPRDEEIDAGWVAYMPALEAKQRANPDNLLRSSHINDPDYPILIEWDEGGSFHIFPKIAAQCEIEAYSINQYVRQPWGGHPTQMPERYYIGGDITAAQVDCVTRRLPEGYEFSQLDGQYKPSEIGWEEGDLPLKDPNPNPRYN